MSCACLCVPVFYACVTSGPGGGATAGGDPASGRGGWRVGGRAYVCGNEGGYRFGAHRLHRYDTLELDYHIIFSGACSSIVVVGVCSWQALLLLLCQRVSFSSARITQKIGLMDASVVRPLSTPCLRPRGKWRALLSDGDGEDRLYISDPPSLLLQLLRCPRK